MNGRCYYSIQFLNKMFFYANTKKGGKAFEISIVLLLKNIFKTKLNCLGTPVILD